MLSKIERKYLEKPSQFSKSYRYVLEYRIKEKLQQLHRLELPLIEQSQNLTEFYKKLTEFHNNDSKNRELRTGSGPVTFTLPNLLRFESLIGI